MVVQSILHVVVVIESPAFSHKANKGEVESLSIGSS